MTTPISPTLRVPEHCAPRADRTDRSSDQPPSTVRSASPQAQAVALAAREAQSTLAVMRMNVDFLVSLLGRSASPLAIAALEDLGSSLATLEERFDVHGAAAEAADPNVLPLRRAA